MIIIQFIWTFFIELPWSIAKTTVIDNLVLKLDNFFSEKPKEVKPNSLETINEFVDRKIKSEKKSKFQERLDNTIESVKNAEKRKV